MTHLHRPVCMLPSRYPNRRVRARCAGVSPAEGGSTNDASHVFQLEPLAQSTNGLKHREACNCEGTLELANSAQQTFNSCNLPTHWCTCCSLSKTWFPSSNERGKLYHLDPW